MDHHEPDARAPSGSGFRSACVECPAARIGCFEAAVGGDARPCVFVKARVAARAPIPTTWSKEFALVLVRRGVVVRTRAPEHGVSIPIDCAGAGAVVPLAENGIEIGYAATDVLVCLYPRLGLELALAHDAGMGRDIIHGLAASLDRVERLAEARGQASVDGRVARVLTAIAETIAAPERRDLLPSGLQQRDLARLAGVRHESFCRTLGQLERRGIVRREPDGLRIVRHDELAALAG